MAIVMLGLACLYFGIFRIQRRHSRLVRVAFGLAAFVLVWCGSVDRLQSFYMCAYPACPAVHVTNAYRFMGVVLHTTSYDLGRSSAVCALGGHKLFLAARIRWFGLLWRQFTPDSPPPGIKRLSYQPDAGLHRYPANRPE